MKRFILITLLLFPVALLAQDNVRFFGYVQPILQTFQSDQDFWDEVKYNTAGVSQANFFVSADFANNLSAFVNFELINNFSTDKKWGALNLQEAYLKWYHSNYLTVKFGQVIPQFNALFEIYNRTPLLPYLVRPKLYEATSGNLVDIFDILPQKAIAQVTGYLPLTDAFKLDYAAYLNHSVNKFHSNPNNDLKPYYVAYGQSASPYLGYGGRIGIRHSNFSIGGSATHDMSNQRRFRWTESGDEANLGDIPRMRLGADFSFNYGPVTLTGEVMVNQSKYEDDRTVTFTDVYDNDLEKTMTLDEFFKYAHGQNKMFIGEGLDKLFYYVTLQYNLTDEIYGFVMYDYLKDEIDPYFFGIEGYKGIALGAGWNVNDNVVLKAQYQFNQALYENTLDYVNYEETEYREHFITLGTSISF